MINDNRPAITLTPSKLAMWRSLIAMGYADGKLADSEKAMLIEYLKRNNIVPEQHAILENDINNGVKINDVYPGVTDIHDRANLIDAARVMFYEDGNFDATEQKIYNLIHHDQENAVDFKAAEEKARAATNAYEAQYNSEELAVRDAEIKKGGVIARLVNYIVDLEDDYFG